MEALEKVGECFLDRLRENDVNLESKAGGVLN